MCLHTLGRIEIFHYIRLSTTSRAPQLFNIGKSCQVKHLEVSTHLKDYVKITETIIYHIKINHIIIYYVKINRTITYHIKTHQQIY